MKAQVAFQRVLRETYESLKTKNSAYSIRAFAKKTGLSPATLSLVFNGKRKVSKKLARVIADRLALDPQQRADLLEQFPDKKKHTDAVDPGYLQLTADQFQIVAEWEAFAILNLTAVKGFKNDGEWIARRLGVPHTTVERTIARLKRLEMLIEDEHENLKRAKPRFRTTDDVANLSLRRSHAQTLELAQGSLDRDPVEVRDFSWVTAAIDTRKLSQAKTLIRKFQDDLFDLLDEGAEPDEVYRLAIQFFPMTRNNNDKK